MKLLMELNATRLIIVINLDMKLLNFESEP